MAQMVKTEPLIQELPYTILAVEVATVVSLDLCLIKSEVVDMVDMEEMEVMVETSENNQLEKYSILNLLYYLFH